MTAAQPATVQRPLALVTGASSGLGAAIARRLTDDGFGVILVARRAERLQELSAELPGSHVFAADLVEDDAPRAIAGFVESLGGKLAVLVNNAGVGGRGTFGDIGFEGYKRTFALNFDAQLRVTEALLPALRAARPSSILIVSTVSGKIARPGAGAYSASKFALNGWADALRAEEAAHGVHVGLILPGFIATEGFPQKELLARPLTARLVGNEGHVAEAAAYLVRTRRPERHAPAPWRIATALAALTPRLMAKVSAKPAMVPGATDR